MFNKEKNIRIKPFESEDVTALESWIYSGEYQDMFRDMLSMTREQLKIYSYMKDGQAFMVTDTKAYDKEIGFVVLYEMRAVPGNLKVAIMIDKSYQEKGYCYWVMRMVCDYVFFQMNFRKIIVEVLDSSERLRSICIRGGMKEECTLEKEANYGDGTFKDVIRYVLFKDTYQKLVSEGFYG